MARVRVLLRNVNPDHHHRVELKLVGGSKGPRDAVGATVYLTAGGIRQRGSVLSGGSCLSSNDLRVHFGLADGMNAGRQRFTGLLAKKESVRLPAIDRMYTITGQHGITGALCGGKLRADPGRIRDHAGAGQRELSEPGAATLRAPYPLTEAIYLTFQQSDLQECDKNHFSAFSVPFLGR